MRLLHLTRSDLNGGAARAVYRLHHSLLAHGVDSHMLVMEKLSKESKIHLHNPTSGYLGYLWMKWRESRVMHPYPKASGFCLPKLTTDPSLITKIHQLEPDIFHIHWINSGVIRIEDLTKIRIPIVWTLHGNWPFTGGCAVFHGCARPTQQCGACPRLESEREADLSRKLWLKKQNTYQAIPHLSFIAPSEWMAETARSSTLLRNHQVIRIPNALNTSTFSPFDQVQARSILNLPQGKKLIAFGADSLANNDNKGSQFLVEALQHPSLRDSELIIFGGFYEQLPRLPQPVHFLGYLRDDLSLRILYSAANIIVVPSIQDNAPQLVTEALSCGTPVAAFASTGLVNQIDHQQNGYLARPFDTSDLAHGIHWILNHPTPALLSQNARKKALTEFDSNISANKHIELYQKVLTNSSNGLNIVKSPMKNNQLSQEEVHAAICSVPNWHHQTHLPA